LTILAPPRPHDTPTATANSAAAACAVVVRIGWLLRIPLACLCERRSQLCDDDVKCRLHKRSLFESSLRLSQACLSKMIVFTP
jgi:hypothetical protein